MNEEIEMQEERYVLLIDSIKDTIANDIYEAYIDTRTETIEEIIDELGYFISEIIIFHQEVIFSDSQSKDINYLRKQMVGFYDSATNGCAKFEVGNLVDAYIKKMIVNVMPCVDGFWLGEENIE